MKLEDAIKSGKFASEQHKVTLNILYTAYWLRSRCAAVLKPLGISMEQHNVLRILNGMHPEPMCVKEIGIRMIEKSSNVPRIIDKLVEKRLVNRSVSGRDKRETLISLNEKGASLVLAAKELLDELTTQITLLDDSQSRQLNELLEMMRG